MINFGILGAGYIANCFAADFHRVKGAAMAAVAARDLERAEAFARKYNIGRAYGNYLELVEDEKVDLVYVATTHNFHLEHVRLCLEHGKHVLVEKPATVNAREFEEMRTLAKVHGLFLMEAMWTAFLPAIQKAQEWVEAGLIGEVKAIQADLGFFLDLTSEKRNINMNLAAGTLLDLMIYPLTFGRIFSSLPSQNGGKPNDGQVAEFQIMADKHTSGADSADMVQLRYANGILGQFSASSCERYHNDGIIIGTRGRIVVPNFHMTKEAVLILEDRNGETGRQIFSSSRAASDVSSVTDENSYKEDVSDKGNILNAADIMGYNYEAQAVVDCLEKGLTECPTMPLSATAQMMQLMDEMRERIGLKYPFEEKY